METKIIQLEQLAAEFRAKTLKSDIDILRSLANSERYFKEVYEGRYILELLQNARDAAMMKEENGKIKIRLFNQKLEIANTGLAFDEAGYKGIMQIGESSKHSQEYIGHKGLGFKSVVQITDRPHVITSEGTIYFDKGRVKKEYYSDCEYLPEKKIPLFFFPLFLSNTILDEPCFNEYTTLIRLPLRAGIEEEEIIENFKKVTKGQLLLLGHIKEINFESTAYQNTILFNKINNKIDIRDNEGSAYYALYKPGINLSITNDIYIQLEDKEKELFKNDRELEIKIVIELDKEKTPITNENRKLYLFYPLEIRSGLSFILHAYFSVDPQRKGLRNTVLNDFLLSNISQYISNGFLGKIKREFPSNVVDLLYFRREIDSDILERFHNQIATNLKDRSFIYDTGNKRFYKPSEIILATEKKQLDVFDNRFFGNKRLIYLNKELRRWLTDEFEVDVLVRDFFLKEIEIYCESRKKDISFFNRLYSYIQEKRYNCISKKILLTPYNTLMDGTSMEIFIPDKNHFVIFSEELSKHISFLHSDIFIQSKNEASKTLGCKEFNTSNIVNRLIQLFDSNTSLSLDIIQSIKSLKWEDISKPSELKIHENILLPVKNKEEWLSPLYNPIYFENEILLSYYPNGNFIDDKELGFNLLDDNDLFFLRKLLVWDKPAVYLKKQYVIQSNEWERNNKFKNEVGLHSTPFTIYHDRFIDIPFKDNIDSEFFSIIKDAWSQYCNFISNVNTSIPKLRCSTSGSNIKTVTNVKDCCHVLYNLQKTKWIYITEKAEFYSPSEIIGINPSEYNRNNAKLLKKYLPLVRISFEKNKTFIQNIFLIHIQGVYDTWDKETIDNYTWLLGFLEEKYKGKEIESKEIFKKFYNSTLKYVFEAYSFLKNKNQEDKFLQRMRRVKFLSINEFDLSLNWEFPENILYVDNKKLYDTLPLSLKKKIQPVFTKRNKNEFGQIAFRIGRVLSKLFSRILVTNYKNELFQSSTEKISNLSYLLCLYESRMNRWISEPEFKKIKEAKWYGLEEVITKISYKEAEKEVYEENILSDWYIDKKDNEYSVLIKENRNDSLSENEFKISVLKDLLEEIITFKVGDDYELLAEKLMNIFSEQEQPDLFFNKYDLSFERLEDIKNILNEKALNSTQQFWQSILYCLEDDVKDEFYEDVEKIWKESILNQKLEKQFFTDFNFQFDYDTYNNNQNKKLLEQLFAILTISVSTFNTYSPYKISFKNEYYLKLNQRKNILNKGFKKWLYKKIEHENNYVKYKLEFEKLQNRYDETIKEVATFSINNLDWDLDSDLQIYLKDKFPNFDVNLTGIKSKNEDGKWSPINYYTRNRNKLRKKILEKGITIKYFDEFIQNKNKSILFFELPENWENEYIDKYKDIDKNASDRGPLYKEEEKEDEDVTMEDFSPTGASFGSSKNGRRNGSGRGGRTSGSSWNPVSEQQKIKIGTKGEFLVYKELIKLHGEGQVFWVSKNGERKGYVSTGDDTLGYDIYYLLDNGDKKYVEVKATKGLTRQFQISQDEIYFGLENKESYEIYFVLDVFNLNKQRKIIKIEKPFVFNENESLFNNTKILE